MREQLEKSFKEAFEKTVAYDGFSVNFADVDDTCFNANVEGTYQFALRGLSPTECFQKLGGQIGETLTLDEGDNEVEVYCNEADSACLAFDCSRTLFIETEDEEDAQELGESVAKSINSAVEKIIAESKKKLNEDDTLPFGRPLK